MSICVLEQRAKKIEESHNKYSGRKLKGLQLCIRTIPDHLMVEANCNRDEVSHSKGRRESSNVA